MSLEESMDRLSATMEKLTEAMTPKPVPVPTPPNTPPLFERWKADIVKYAQIHGAKLLDPTLTGAQRLDLFYYDTAFSYHSLAGYFQDSFCLKVRDEAIKIYRDEYLKPNDYKAAGWMIFPHGLYHHYKATGDEESKKALLLLSTNAAYAQSGEPIDTWLAPAWMSREAAYNLEAKLYSRDLGGVPTFGIDKLMEICLGHLREWRDILNGRFTPTDQQDCRPFMTGITCQALIERYVRADASTEIKSIIRSSIETTLNLLWETMYLPDSKAMKYTDRPISGIGGPTPAPDLNMLIAPAYAWIGQKDRADLLFEGSVEGAFLAGHKQFAQSVRWVFDYLTWRQA